jgi:hypothetical protein
VVTSTIYTMPSGSYPAATCWGTPAPLYPGITRCLVFTVQNTLNVPISLQSITTSLDPTYPTPPADCSGSNLSLPSFSGSFSVGSGATKDMARLQLLLKNINADQSDCAAFVYHFKYTATAQYADSTTTVLVSAPNPSTTSDVTFTATVTAGNPSTDTSLPSGTVDFYQCPSTLPGSGTLLGIGTIGAGGNATYSTSLGAGTTTYVEAVYPGSGTDFSSSTSNVVTQVVNP